jgi:hypothetical protein
VAFRLVAISLRQILRLVFLWCRSSRSKDLEVLILDQELDVFRRQLVRLDFDLRSAWSCRCSSSCVPSEIGSLRRSRRTRSAGGIERWPEPSGSTGSESSTEGESPSPSSCSSGGWPAQPEPGCCGIRCELK